MSRCPQCDCEGEKVIYLGFPMKLCPNEWCNTVWGNWSWVAHRWFNGYFMRYDGNYLPALWHWLTGDLNE